MKVDIYNTNKKYNIIYADPPWEYKQKQINFQHYNEGKKYINSVNEHYNTKKIPEKIKNYTANVGRVDDSNIEKYIHILFEQQSEIIHKFDELIDYLESKGE